MTPEVLRYAVFTEDGRGGRPAGVVLDAHALTGAEMLAVAQAIGYPRTAFVVREAPGGRAAVRFFGPDGEAAAGHHAAHAAAVAIAERRGPGTLRLDTPAGAVTVSTAGAGGDPVAAVTLAPTATRPLPDRDPAAIPGALGRTRDRLDPRFPAGVTSAGGRRLLLGVRDRGALAGRADVPPATDLFWAEDATTFHLRAVDDDPAVCDAAAALGGYLRDLGLVPLPSRLVLRHADGAGRPSRLLVDVAAGTATVRVAGHATRLALSPYDDLQPL
jgi:predicted PhzF superfamily epimerase YddE/YHI9